MTSFDNSAVGTATLLDKAIVVVDMVGYGSVARLLEENGGPVMVAQLNRQIEQLIEVGVASLPDSSACRIVAGTGDGAVLMFDRCEDACLFAETVHEAALDRNRQRQEISARRVFRIGIACGDVTWERKGETQQGFAGMTIANAVRLEGAAVGGQTVVDHCVYDHLPNEMKVRFGAEEVVRGKRDEVFRARRSQWRHDLFVAPKPRSLRLTRRSTLLGVGASVVAAAGGWYGWSRGSEMLHPLPQKRFVAVVNWPVVASELLAPIISGLVEAVGHQLSQAESMDRDLLVIPQQENSQFGPELPLKRLHETLGTNLVLSISGKINPGTILVNLRLTDSTSAKTLRNQDFLWPLVQQLSLPGKAVGEAAKMLGVESLVRTTSWPPSGTHSAKALAAFQAGEALRKQDNDAGLNDAIRKYREAVEEDPQFAAPHAKLSAAYFRYYVLHGDAGALKLAGDNARTAIGLDQSLVAAHVALSSVLQNTGDETGASNELTIALSLDPTDWHTLVYRGQLFARLNNWKDAERTFARVRDARPNYWLARNELGILYASQAKYRQALDEFSAAALAAPGNALAVSNQSWICSKMGHFEEAIEFARRSLLLDAKAIENNRMAFAQLGQGAFIVAIKFAVEAAQLDPFDVDNWLLLGDCCEAAGRRAQGIDSYLRGANAQLEELRTDTTNGPGWISLALCFAKTGKMEDARNAINRGTKLPIGDFDSQLALARVRTLLGDKDQAATVLTKCMQMKETTFQIGITPDIQDVLPLLPR